MNKQNLYYIFILSISLLGCEKWNLEEVNFLTLNIKDIQPISITSLSITGEIRGLEIGEVSDHGFVWTNQTEIPNILLNEKESLGILSKGDSSCFSSIIDNLIPNTMYIFAVYAQTNENVVYSDTLHYHTGTGMVTTDSLRYIQGTTNIILYGSYFGEEAGLIAIQHGFCWSSNNLLPTFEDDHSTLGNLQVNQSFNFTFEELLKDIPFYFRAYVIVEHSLSLRKDTLYGETLFFDGLFNVWTQKADFGGIARNGAVGFSIGNKGYIGTGLDINFNETNDFWEYDPSADHWTQKANFGGSPRWKSVGFSIENKGFIGTGEDNLDIIKNDFWEYNPETDLWVQKADFGGGPRNGAVGFSIGNKGFIGTGGEELGFSPTTDLWEYDPDTDQWAQKADFEGGGRFRSVGFSIGNKGYIGPGRDTGIGISSTDEFWEYDPNFDLWTRKADFEGGERFWSVGFSIGNKGYIGTGSNLFTRKSDFWEYTPSTDNWMQKPDFEGSKRSYAVGFSIGNKGYIGTGFDGERRNDFWEY